ncbi:Cytochrome c oxidase subunit 6B1 [Halotydeus destructor]|nr:Cytochrome c oxidase subunit 6B1 [Halotydeus destructor]
MANRESDEEVRKGLPFAPPFDPRFPNVNQTRNCYTNYLDFHRCQKVRTAQGKDVEPCEWFKKVYTAMCPSDWSEHWDEQRENGIFPGKI